MDESSVDGWFKPIAESNALFLRRESGECLVGLDERFDSPGGGLLNLDTFNRAIEWPDAQLVVLLGEATFHQLHGGTNTNIPLVQQQRELECLGAPICEHSGTALDDIIPRAQKRAGVCRNSPAAYARAIRSRRCRAIGTTNDPTAAQLVL